MLTTPAPRKSSFRVEELWADWRAIAADIGERAAGTANERTAADFIRQRFSERLPFFWTKSDGVYRYWAPDRRELFG